MKRENASVLFKIPNTSAGWKLIFFVSRDFIVYCDNVAKLLYRIEAAIGVHSVITEYLVVADRRLVPQFADVGTRIYFLIKTIPIVYRQFFPIYFRFL